MKYHFKKLNDARDFQEECKDCDTRKYYVNGSYVIIIIKTINLFGNFKRPIIPDLDSHDTCFNAYQNAIENLQEVLNCGNIIEKKKVRQIILTISELQEGDF